MDWTKTEAKESRGQTTKSIASSGQTGLRLRKYISHKEHFFVFTSLFCNLIPHLPTAFWLLGARLQLCSGALRNHSRKKCRRNSRKGILKKGMYPLGIRYKRTGRIYPKIQTVLTFCLFTVAQQQETLPWVGVIVRFVPDSHLPVVSEDLVILREIPFSQRHSLTSIQGKSICLYSLKTWAVKNVPHLTYPSSKQSHLHFPAQVSAYIIYSAALVLASNAIFRLILSPLHAKSLAPQPSNILCMFPVLRFSITGGRRHFAPIQK